MTPKARANKEKIALFKKSEKTPAEWEEIFANCVSDKGLVSRICKELSNLNYEKKKSISKWAKDLNGHLTKEDIWVTNKCIKRCSTSSVIREM